jgi:transcriptional regulator with XRE-family HTH domain
MDAGFGARLRAHRESRQLTLQAIAERTKIKQSLLQGLERDDLSAWPKGIFRRAFVRDYARAIGLDPDTIVREFLERYPDPVEQTPFGPGGAPLKESDLVQVHSEPATRLQRLIVAARTAVPTLLTRGDRANKFDTPSHSAAPDPAGRPHPAPPFAEAALDLNALAEVCTRFALVADWEQFKTALAETTRILDAVGAMLWCWEAGTALLTPVATHGYPDAVVDRLPRIHRGDNNAIAEAFRSAATCVVPATRGMTAAVAVPVLAPVGCVGVLAFEVRDGRERESTVAAAARIIAAQLAALLTPAEEPHAASA